MDTNITCQIYYFDPVYQVQMKLGTPKVSLNFKYVRRQLGAEENRHIQMKAKLGVEAKYQCGSQQ